MYTPALPLIPRRIKTNQVQSGQEDPEYDIVEAIGAQMNRMIVTEKGSLNISVVT